ncbi:F54F27, partial [Caligus rogercresseyi]
KLGKRVKPIEESFELSPRFPGVSERYYEKYYYLDPDRQRSRDQVLLLHSNRIVL